MDKTKNGFGALRLLFASLVIASHAPEFIDGNRSREPLTQVFHTLSFGTIAVDAFFLISGYLITASFMRSSSILDYFTKRVLRIFPAFVAVFIVCLFVVAPLTGGLPAEYGPATWGRQAFRLLTLRDPDVPSALHGLPYPYLDGAVWTIAYEFRCYVLVAVFGVLGLFRHRGAFLALTIAALAAPWIAALPPIVRFDDALRLTHWAPFTGAISDSARLFPIFLVGSAIYLWRDKLNWTPARVSAAAAALFGLMFVAQVAELAFVTLGAYLLFWVAFKVDWKPLRTINATDDISYGVYLWASPIAVLAIYYWRDINPLLLGALMLVGSAAMGALSWRFIEKPALALKDRRRRLEAFLSSQAA